MQCHSFIPIWIFVAPWAYRNFARRLHTRREGSHVGAIKHVSHDHGAKQDRNDDWRNEPREGGTRTFSVRQDRGLSQPPMSKRRSNIAIIWSSAFDFATS